MTKYIVIRRSDGHIARFETEQAMLAYSQNYLPTELEVWEVKRPVVLVKQPAIVMAKAA